MPIKSINAKNCKIRLIYIFLLTSNLISAQCKIDYSNYTLHFEDEFNYTSLDELQAIWQTETCDPNSGQGATNFVEEGIDLSQAGILRLKCFKVPSYTLETANGTVRQISHEGGIIQGTCGAPYTHNYRFGMFEIRCKMSSVPAWASFWLYGNKSELDVFETMTSRRFSTNLWDNTESPSVICQIYHDKLNSNNLNDQFHTYTAVWTPEKTTFFFDGREIRTVDTTMVNMKGGMQLRANIANNSYALDNMEFDIDYIRVYKANNDNYSSEYKSTAEYMYNNIDTELGGITGVYPEHGSITCNKFDSDEIAYRGSDEHMYHGIRTGDIWKIEKLNFPIGSSFLNVKVNGDVVFHPSRDMIIYRGGDNKLQYFEKVGDSYVIHGYVKTNAVPCANKNGIVVVTHSGLIAYQDIFNRILLLEFEGGAGTM